MSGLNFARGDQLLHFLFHTFKKMTPN
jgi:hypothetical protein